MELSHPSSTSIAFVEFNESQKLAMAAALRQVADECFSSGKQRAPLKHGDCIDLLNSDESDEEYENSSLATEPIPILTPKKEIVMPVPISAKFENTVDTLEFLAEENEQTVSYDLPTNQGETFSSSGLFVNDKLEILGVNTTAANATQNNDQVPNFVSSLPMVEVVASNMPNSTTTAQWHTKIKDHQYREDEDDLVTFGCVFPCDRDDLYLNNSNSPRSVSTADASENEIIELSDEETCENDTILVESDEEHEGRYNRSENALDRLTQFYCPQCNLLCDTIKIWTEHTEKQHNFASLDILNLRTIISKEGSFRYQCKDCLAKFDMKLPHSKLLQHRIDKHMPYAKILKCRLCPHDYRFKCKSSLRVHIMKNHTKIFNSYAPSRQRGKQSIYSDILNRCLLCTFSSSSQSKWINHIRAEHKDFVEKLENNVTVISDSVVQCKECDRRFLPSNTFYHGLKHEQSNCYKCQKCGHEGKSRIAMLVHFRHKHLQQQENFSRRYNCRYCDLQFDKYIALKKHKIEKHKVEKLECPECHKLFAAGASLLNHMRKTNHHRLK